MILLGIVFALTGKAIAVQYAFRVNFTDKNNTPYSLSSPLSYLSPRAIDRRTRYSIAIDSTDLPVNQAYINDVLSLTGGTMHEVSRWFNFCVILIADSATIHVLDGQPHIQSTQLVAYYAGMLHKPAASAVPAAQKTATGGSTYYGETWNQTSIVKGNHLHDNGFTGTGKLIAVIDAGYTATDTHPGFVDLVATRLIDKHNFTLASDFVYSYDSHGTKVLSTMAGNVPGTYVGSAPTASYALYVTEDGTSEQPIELINMVSAAERADSIGADIITTSLGYNRFDNPAYDFTFAADLDGKTTIAAQGANMATRKGILFVATAGNEGGNSWNMLLTPGDADSALTVGSVEVSGVPAGNSGYGPNAAGRVKPDVCAMGQPANIFNTTGGYGSEGGTSFSTPQVAGWAACLLQANPAATPYQLRQAITRCASIYNTPDNHLGYGIPDFQCSSQVLLYVINTPPPFTTGNWVIAAPNPCSSELLVSIDMDTAQFVDLSLVDVTGKVIITRHQYFYKGFNAPLSWSVQDLPSGIYILKAVSATGRQVIKIEKL